MLLVSLPFDQLALNAGTIVASFFFFEHFVLAPKLAVAFLI